MVSISQISDNWGSGGNSWGGVGGGEVKLKTWNLEYMNVVDKV